MAKRNPRNRKPLKTEPYWVDFAVAFGLLGLQWRTFVSGDLVHHLHSWIDGGLADRFYFLHKPPGMHLRFRAQCGRLVPQIAAFLDETAAAHGLERWHHSVYDCETSRFGGEVGMDIAHDFFTAESLLVLGYLRAYIRDEARLSRPQISLFLLLELFERLVDGRWELWDVWCKMELVDRIPPLSPRVLADARVEADRASSVVGPLLSDRIGLLETAGPVERELVKTFQPQVQRIARRLLIARDEGKLLYGLRSILPSWAVFHWNRMGFSGEEQNSICLAMIYLLRPEAR
jgi:thiopeptide-type bacteriocin biosynthesis protein